MVYIPDWRSIPQVKLNPRYMPDRSQPLSANFRDSLSILTGGQQRARVPGNQTFAYKTGQQTNSILDRLRQMQNNTGGSMNSPVAGGSTTGGGSEFNRLVSAIAGKESGGNYRAVNRSSGALGKYQIMPGNVGPWSREILGRTVSTSEFLRNPQLQDAIARGKLQQYYKQYGAAGAATAWYAGPGAVRNKMGSTRKQGAYPSINAYWQDILRRMR